MIRRKASTRGHALEEAKTTRDAYLMIQRKLEPTRNKVIYEDDALRMSAMQHEERRRTKNRTGRDSYLEVARPSRPDADAMIQHMTTP